MPVTSHFVIGNLKRKPDTPDKIRFTRCTRWYSQNKTHPQFSSDLISWTVEGDRKLIQKHRKLNTHFFNAFSNLKIKKPKEKHTVGCIDWKREKDRCGFCRFLIHNLLFFREYCTRADSETLHNPDKDLSPWKCSRIRGAVYLAHLSCVVVCMPGNSVCHETRLDFFEVAKWAQMTLQLHPVGPRWLLDRSLNQSEHSRASIWSLQKSWFAVSAERLKVR